MRAWVRGFCVVASIAAVGCNGDDGGERLTRAEFQREIFSLIEDSSAPNALYYDLVSDAQATEECKRVAVRFHDQVDAFVERVRALEPPEAVEAIHADFSAAAEEWVDRVEAVREGIDAGELSCGQQVNNLLYDSRALRQALRALDELEQHGYYVFGQ